MGRRHYRITLGDAINAHDFALTQGVGGRQGVVSTDMILSAIGRPYSGYHLPIYRKAAALLESIIRNHGFADGNKRTAWVLTEMLIDRSGYLLNIPDDEPVDDLVVAVASGEMEFDAIVDWFKARIIKV